MPDRRKKKKEIRFLKKIIFGALLGCPGIPNEVASECIMAYVLLSVYSYDFCSLWLIMIMGVAFLVICMV